MQSSPNWTEIVTAVAAVVALLIALLSLAVAWRAQQLVERQEMRRQPHLVPTLINGFRRTNANERHFSYAFFLSVSNPRDVDNAIAMIELRIAYTTQTNVLMTILLPLSPTDAHRFATGSGAVLNVPTRVAAHDTLSGWCYFGVDADVLNDARIESHAIILTDSQRQKSSVEPIIIQEYQNGY